MGRSLEGMLGLGRLFGDLRKGGIGLLGPSRGGG